MPDMISLGPLLLSTQRLLAILGILAFLTLGGWLGKRQGRNVDALLWIALLAGLMVARLGYIALHWGEYRLDGWSWLQLTDGGFALWPGVGAAMLVLLLQLKGARQAWPFLAMTGGVAAVVALAGLLITPPAPIPLPRGVMVQTMDETQLSLDRYRGQPLVINLWATWCGPCRRELPMLMDEAARSDMPVLLVDQGETTAQVQAYLRGEGLSDTHVLRDPEQRLLRISDGQGLPTTLFINARGEIVTRWTGEISRAAMRSEMAKLR